MIWYASVLTSRISERSPVATSRSASGIRFRIRSAATSPRSVVRAPTSTRAPRPASWAAIASPMPLVAPVTRKVDVVVAISLFGLLLHRIPRHRRSGLTSIGRKEDPGR
jgi:hypothetical protein